MDCQEYVVEQLKQVEQENAILRKKLSMFDESNLHVQVDASMYQHSLMRAVVHLKDDALELVNAQYACIEHGIDHAYIPLQMSEKAFVIVQKAFADAGVYEIINAANGFQLSIDMQYAYNKGCVSNKTENFRKAHPTSNMSSITSQPRNILRSFSANCRRLSINESKMQSVSVNKHWGSVSLLTLTFYSIE